MPSPQKEAYNLPREEFDWEKAYQFAEGMLRLSELGLDFWKEEQHRERKLKESPNGFPLEGAGRTCAICSHSCPEGETWYDQYGIKCLACQGAIDRGEIPASLASDEGRDNWYSMSDLEHKFDVKAKVVRRWVKAGILKARTLTHEERMPLQIFLIEENKDTLPPKALVKDRSVKEQTKDGQDSYHHEPWFCFVNPAEHLKGYKIVDHLQQLTPDDHYGKYFKLSVVPAIPYLFSADAP